MVCSRHLFGESLEMILRAEKGIELIGPWTLGDEHIGQRLVKAGLSVVIIADEDLESAAAAELTKSIIEQCSGLSVIRIGLTRNVFRIVSAQTLPALGAGSLQETIRNVLRTQEQTSSQTKYCSQENV